MLHKVPEASARRARLAGRQRDEARTEGSHRSMWARAALCSGLVALAIGLTGCGGGAEGAAMTAESGRTASVLSLLGS